MAAEGAAPRRVPPAARRGSDLRARGRRGRSVGTPVQQGFDGYAFTLSFKGVFLEGLEVAFIVVTVGAAHDNFVLAIVAAVPPSSGRDRGCDRSPPAEPGAREHDEARRRSSCSRRSGRSGEPRAPACSWPGSDADDPRSARVLRRALVRAGRGPESCAMPDSQAGAAGADADEAAPAVRPVLVRLRDRRRLAPRVRRAAGARARRAGVAHADRSAWWIVPAAVALLLGVSVLRATPNGP